MERRIFFLFVVTAHFSLLFAAKQTFRDVLPSLHFTREALLDFARGSRQTVDIKLMPKNKTMLVNKKYFIRNNSCGGIQECVASSVKLVELTEVNGESENESNTMELDEYFTLQPEDIDNFLDRPTKKNLPREVIVKVQAGRENARGRLVVISFNETKIVNSTKREVYRPRTSPSNKFMKALKDVELALVNANAYAVRFSHDTLPKLKALVERAIQKNNYKYARQVRPVTHYIRNVTSKDTLIPRTIVLLVIKWLVKATGYGRSHFHYISSLSSSGRVKTLPLASCKGIRFRNPGKFCFWNPESSVGIQDPWLGNQNTRLSLIPLHGQSRN